jgi:two-component system nitrogen regulation sensor histidine kinase NtrY
MLGQALANVLKNAGEAIATRRSANAAPGEIFARLIVRNDSVEYVIEDNGVGLPPRDRDRLTEPYVTTREKGTGLGLAIVKRIAEEHGGRLILADRGKAKGAKVVLALPYRQPSPVVEPAGVDAGAMRTEPAS